MKIAACLGVLAFSTQAVAHGQVTAIVAGGIRYQGYLPQFQYRHTPPKVAGWSTPQDSKNGPVYPSSYNKQDIICHIAATPGGTSIPVSAGSTIELQWTPWPLTHHGPVIDYLANCNGPCNTVDKAKLQFKKIDATGLLRDSTAAGQVGYWGADRLRDTNNSWTVTVPSTIATGNYVLRHEIIALHSARILNGAQNYPHCINLQVTGGGSDHLAQGTLGTELYKENDPGIKVDIYKPLEYTMPGPALYSRGRTATTLVYGNLTSGSRNPTNVGPKTGVSPASDASAPQVMGVLQPPAPFNTNATGAKSSAMTSALPVSVSQSAYSGSSSPKLGEIHQTTGSLFDPALYPKAGSQTSSALPDLSGPSQPTTASSFVTPSAFSETIKSTITPPASSSAPSNLSSAKPKPCTRRIRITTSPRSTSISSTTPPSSSSTQPSLPTGSGTQDKQEQTVPVPSSNPQASSTSGPPATALDGLSVQQLMRWLRAVVSALSQKLHGNQARKRVNMRAVL